MRNRLFITVFLFLLLAGVRSSQAKDPAPNAQQLMDAAHRQVDLAGMIPYVLTGNVVIDPGGKREKTGHLTIYRDRDRSRVELQFGDYKEIRMSIGERKYIPRDKHALTAMGLVALDDNWDPGLPLGSSSKPVYKFGKVRKATVDGRPAWCFDEKWESDKKRLCFDAERSLLISEGFGSENRQEYLDYASDAQLAFPRLVKLSKKRILPLEIRDISVSRGSLDEKLFSKPPNAIELETCKDIRPPQPVTTPDPPLPDAKHHVHETVRLDAIITRDGRVEEVQVLNQEEDAYTESAKHAVAQWTFKPATCSGRTVNTEMNLEINFKLY